MHHPKEQHLDMTSFRRGKGQRPISILHKESTLSLGLYVGLHLWIGNLSVLPSSIELAASLSRPNPSLSAQWEGLKFSQMSFLNSRSDMMEKKEETS